MSQEDLTSLLNLAARLSLCSAPTTAFGELAGDEIQLVDATIKAFVSGSPADRVRATETLSAGARALLIEYAREAAMKAVRERAPRRLEDGLFALALEGGKQDPRDTIVVMTVLSRSGEILGVDSTALFLRASELFSDDWLKTEVRDFPARSKARRDPRGFGIAEKVTPVGFACQQCPMDFRPAIRRARIVGMVRNLREKFLR